MLKANHGGGFIRIREAFNRSVDTADAADKEVVEGSSEYVEAAGAARQEVVDHTHVCRCMARVATADSCGEMGVARRQRLGALLTVTVDVGSIALGGPPDRDQGTS